PLALLDTIAEAVRGLEPEPKAAGFGVPGEVDDEGRCYRLPNAPGFDGVAMQREMEARLGCPVKVENEATAAGLAELHYGHGREHPSFLLITLGTGIGGSVVIDGKVRRGRHGFGGELGHIALHREDSWPCACGQSGCLEAYAGTKALHRYFAAGGGQAKEVRDIADSARRGERAGIATFEQLGEALADGIRSLQCVLDVDAIVFSGGISAAFDLFEPSCRATLRARAYGPPLGEVPLLTSVLGERAGQIGAALLSRQD
ncbi:MAG: ROK family protein, partial [Sphingomonas sp.]|uniref:ROK family protein n=1 Tax=Sphingomonas sp. TaxID=28214 RepID=UPI002585DC91